MIWLWCWQCCWWRTARVPQPIIDRATPFLLFCNRYRLFACSSASYSLLCNAICFTQLDDVNSIGWEADSSWISITLRRRWELVTTNVCQPTNRFLPRFDKGKAIDWVGEGSSKGRHRPNDHQKMPRKRKRWKSIRWSFLRTPQKVWTACKNDNVKTVEVMAFAVVKIGSSLLRDGASSNMCREVELLEVVVDLEL